jgi:hypothetical protein
MKRQKRKPARRKPAQQPLSGIYADLWRGLSLVAIACFISRIGQRQFERMSAEKRAVFRKRFGLDHWDIACAQAAIDRHTFWNWRAPPYVLPTQPRKRKRHR